MRTPQAHDRLRGEDGGVGGVLQHRGDSLPSFCCSVLSVTFSSSPSSSRTLFALSFRFFNHYTFKLEESVYTAEKIAFDHVSYIDNQPVLDLIENKPRGAREHGGRARRGGFMRARFSGVKIFSPSLYVVLIFFNPSLD